MPLDLPPPLWLPPKPAIIRPAPEILSLVRQARREHQATFPFPTFCPSGVAKTLRITNTANTSNLANQSSYSYATVAIGDAPSAGERRFIVVVNGSSSGSGASDPSGTPTIAGINTTTPTGGFLTDNQSSVWIYYAEVPTGTTATIAHAFGETHNGDAISVFRIISTGNAALSFGTAQATTTGATLSVNVPVQGVAVGGTSSSNGANVTWTGMTKVQGTDLLSNEWVTMAYVEINAGNPSLSVSVSATASEQSHLCFGIGPS